MTGDSRSRSIGIVTIVLSGGILLVLCAVLTYDPPHANRHINLFYTARSMGSIEPCDCAVNPSGGLPRRATFIREHSSDTALTVVVDGGTLLNYPTRLGRLSTEYLFKGMCYMGYTVLGLGARDFEYGLDYLRRIENDYGFTFVSSNAVDSTTREPLFPSYSVIHTGQGSIFGVRYGGVSIGVTSVFGLDWIPQFPDSLPLVALEDPIASVEMVAREMRRECDLVVVFAHASRDVCDSLVQNDDVDVVIVSRSVSGTSGDGNVSCQEHGVLAFTAYQARRVGMVNITLADSGGIASASGDLYGLGPDIEDDPALSRLVEIYKQSERKMIRRYAQPAGN